MAIEDEMKDVQQLVVNQLGVANGLTDNNLADGQVTTAKIADGAVTTDKLNLSATGQSATIATFKTTQTDSGGGQTNRSLDIRTPPVDDLNSPFTFLSLMMLETASFPTLLIADKA